MEDRVKKLEEEVAALKEQIEALNHRQEDYGPVYPRTYDRCPVCNCPERFTEAAVHKDGVTGTNPALFKLTYKYRDFTGRMVNLALVGDSCRRCGVLRTICRDRGTASGLRIGRG